MRVFEKIKWWVGRDDGFGVRRFRLQISAESKLQQAVRSHKSARFTDGSAVSVERPCDMPLARQHRNNVELTQIVTAASA